VWSGSLAARAFQERVKREALAELTLKDRLVSIAKFLPLSCLPLQSTLQGSMHRSISFGLIEETASHKWGGASGGLHGPVVIADWIVDGILSLAGA